MLKHVIPYFDVRVYDAFKDLSAVAETYNVDVESLSAVASCDVVVLAVPVREMEKTVAEVAPFLRDGQLVIDLCSVKCKPIEIMKRLLPQGVDVVGLHPLFGPQSGKNGIAGLNVTLCPVRGGRDEIVAHFLREKFNLNVFVTTPENHDREMAYVQGLTHMMCRVFLRMDVPDIHQQTKTYGHLLDMIELIRYDSEELFLAIQRDNPYVRETTDKFFSAVRELEDKLNAAAEK